MIEEIHKEINNIYENVNIYKALFVINSEISHDLKIELEKNEYFISDLNSYNEFINHNSRILYIKDIELNNITENDDILNSLPDINLLIFIKTPIIKDNFFYNYYFNMSDLNDKYNNIFQI